MEKTRGIRLGKSDIIIPRMCIGTWAWGEGIVFGKSPLKKDLEAVYQESMNRGFNFFDTAEIYGSGKSERILGSLAEGYSEKQPIIASKFYPKKFNLDKEPLYKSLKASLNRMNIKKLDLYQIHIVENPKNISRWINSIGDAYEEGLIGAIGVSNYSCEYLKQAYDILDKRGISLASNQMHYSLLYRHHERNGLMELCKELDVTFLGYMSLAHGLLTGKYTPNNRPTGLLRRFTYNKKLLTHIGPLIQLMKEIGESHGGKTCAQVALNWSVCKGAIPIVGATNLKQLNDNLAAATWELTNEEVAMLDELTDKEYRDSFKLWYQS